MTRLARRALVLLLTVVVVLLLPIVGSAVAGFPLLAQSGSPTTDAPASTDAPATTDAPASTDTPAAPEAPASPGAAEGGSDTASTVSTQSSEEGRRVFQQQCAICHGLEGSGRLGPALVGNSNLQRQDYVTALILRGGDGMPAFQHRLSEAAIAAVTGYIRTAWDNDYGPVDTELLAAQWWTGANDAAELFDRVCARCHGEDGGGGIGPPLAGNENLTDARYVVGKILHGQGGMPAFDGILRPDRVAELARYVRNGLGNSFGGVDFETVTSLSLAGRGGSGGALQISAFPSDVRLAVTGPDRFVHNVAGSDGLSLSDLLPGTYAVTASRDGYRPESLLVEVRGGVVSRASVVLEPLFEDYEDEREEPAQRAEDSAESEPEIEAQPEPARDVQPPASADLAGDSSTARATTTVGTATSGASRQSRAFNPPPAPAFVILGRLPEGHDPVPAGESGASLYIESCALCHGPQGEGGVGPSLAGNPTLPQTRYIIETVLDGRDEMPAFASRLTDEQIAAVVNHERSSWGNSAGEITPEQVANQRTSEPSASTGFAGGVAGGEEIYEANCSVCHGSNGAGLAAPGFRGNPNLNDASYVVSRIVMGGGGMPPFGELLSNAEMARVASYIREAWGNDFGSVDLQVAQSYHGGFSSRE